MDTFSGRFLTLLSVDASILSCVLEEAPSEYFDAQIRVNCEYLENSCGMEFLVTLKGKPKPAPIPQFVSSTNLEMTPALPTTFWLI